MAVRPWVLPQEVRDYTDIPSVIERSDAKLEVDIARAEWYIIAYTRNNFSDVKYTFVPEPVRLAVILLAESYAASSAGLAQGVGNYKSESFDDYSYTVADTEFKQRNLDLGPLLDEFKLSEGNTEIFMRMRKL